MCPTTGGSVSPQNLQMKGGNGQKGEQVSYFIPEWSWCIGCIERKGIVLCLVTPAFIYMSMVLWSVFPRFLSALLLVFFFFVSQGETGLPGFKGEKVCFSEYTNILIMLYLVFFLHSIEGHVQLKQDVI